MLDNELDNVMLYYVDFVCFSATEVAISSGVCM